MHGYRHVMPWAVGALILLAMLGINSHVMTGFEFMIASENPLRNFSAYSVIVAFSFSSIIALIFIKHRGAFWGWMIVLLSFAVVSLTYQSITGNAFNMLAARVILTEASGLQNIMTFYGSDLLVIAVHVIVCTLLLLLVRHYTKSVPLGRFGNIAANVWLALTVSITVALAYYKGAEAIKFIPEPFRAISALTVAGYDNFTQGSLTRNDVTIKVTQEQKRHIILVVDESIRSDFGERDTDYIRKFIPPSLQTKMALFHNAYSGHSCSNYSNAVMRWGLQWDKLNVAQTKPTIWQYAKAAGYETVYIDAQKNDGTLQNFMNGNEWKQIDQFIQFDHVTQIERDPGFMTKDKLAAEKVNALVKSDKPKFIMVVKLGAHFPYDGKYPSTSEKRKPTMGLTGQFKASSHQQVLNSYRNAIDFNFQQFFPPLFNRGFAEDYLLIYTSDHGQNFSNPESATHCNGNESIPEIFRVPLMVLTDDQAKLSAMIKARNASGGYASHTQIFPTLLKAMGYGGAVDKGEGKDLLSPMPKNDIHYSAHDILSQK